MEKDEEPEVVTAHVLLPHEVFGALHGASRSKAGEWGKTMPAILENISSPQQIHEILQPCQFRSLMCGDHDGQSIYSFWGHLKTLCDYKYHRVLHSLTDSELAKTIPFAIHGDGAEFHRHSEYFVWSWTSAFQCGGGSNCLMSRFPIALVAETQMSEEWELWI